MNKDVMINVTNRSHSSVGYPVPDNTNGLTRQFAVGETKQISFDELQKLSWMPGGMYLLQNCLVIKNEEAVSEILGDVEPEYYYTEEDIKTAKDKLEQLQNEISSINDESSCYVEYLDIIKSFLDMKNPTREIMNRLIDKIYVTKDKKLEIHYRIKKSEVLI